LAITRSALFRCVLILFFVATLSSFSHFVVVDDAFIYARYIQNAIDGHGLVFNVGERVNALTSPLYCYLMLAVVKLLHGHVLLVLRLLFLVFWCLSCLVAEALAPFAGVFMAACAYFYSLQGMETPVFLFFIALALWLYREEHWNWLPLVYVLLSFTRFEGALLALLLFVAQALRRKWPFWGAWFPVPLLLAGYLAFNVHWYGSLLPSSAGAKFGQGMSGYWGRWPLAFLDARPLVKTTGWAMYLLPVALYLAWRGARTSLKEGVAWVRPALLFAAGLAAFYILFNLPDYHWYYAPFMYLGLIFAALGIPRRPAYQPLIWAAVLFFAAAGVRSVRKYAPRIDYIHADAWLLAHAPAGSRIATAETGQIGWDLQNYYVIDTVGLTTPANAVYTAHRQPERWLSEDHPDYAFVHINPWRWESPVANSPDYVMVPVEFGEVRLFERRDLAREEMTGRK
jgi:arabinofuranosyltransferase